MPTTSAETPGAEAASPVPDPEGVRRAGDAIEVEPAFRFEIDDDELRAESLPTLDALATFLRNHPDIVRLEVQGHTDDRGLEVGRPLGMARATTIVEGLVARGVDGARLYACGYGALRPRVSGTSQVARAANRRIELVVRAEGATCNPQAP
ncbi:MAG: OmpA family protein [Sandaracinus sp.]